MLTEKERTEVDKARLGKARQWNRKRKFRNAALGLVGAVVSLGLMAACCKQEPAQTPQQVKKQTDALWGGTSKAMRKGVNQ
jgi:hypothetical protein